MRGHRPPPGQEGSADTLGPRVRLTLDLSFALNERMDALAAELGSSKSDLLRKAIALADVAVRARADGRRLAVVDDHGRVVTSIMGL